MPTTIDDLTAHREGDLQTSTLWKYLSLSHTLGAPDAVFEAFQDRWPRSPHLQLLTQTLDGLHRKAAVAAGDTTTPGWAGSLVTAQLSTGFLAALRASSVLAQLPVVPVPFGTAMTTLTAGSSSAWIGQGLPKPVSTMGFSNQPALAVKKASSIVVLTKELASLSAAGSEQAIQTILINEIVAFTDGTLLGPGAATAAAPAGLLNAVVASADLATTIKTFFTARPKAARPYWIVSPAALGVLALEDKNVPATYRGYPIAVSPGAGVNAILVDAAGLAVADDGVEVDVSQQAAIQMNDAPDSPPTAATVVRSLWQDNLAAYRAERTINWAKDTNSVQFAVVLA